MRVFVTGATGFIGSAVVSELIDAGYQVVGLARSDSAAEALAAVGAEAHRGSLEDLDSLRRGAAAADGVIHTAFIHDFSQIQNAGQADRRAIEALGSVLGGPGRPLVVTSGTGLAAPGRVVTENDLAGDGAHHRVDSEQATLSLASRGVRASLLRPPASVHGEGDHGFVPVLIDIARAKGVSGHVGDGSNRWPAVHRLDIAPLYRLAVEKAPSGAVLNAVAEEGIPTREIAEVIGRYLDVPVVSIDPEAANDHFGWISAFFALDMPASSALTRGRMEWEPMHVGLIADLEEGHYFLSDRSVLTPNS